MKPLTSFFAVGCLLPAAVANAQTISRWTLLANHLDYPGFGGQPTNAIANILPVCSVCPVSTSPFQGGNIFLPRTPDGDKPVFFSFSPGETIQILSSFPPYTDGFFNTFTNAHWEWNALPLDTYGAGYQSHWFFPNMIWHPGDGMIVESTATNTYRVGDINATTLPRVPSGRQVHIPPGQSALLAAETATNGTYEIVVGLPPAEGSQVYRLNAGGYIGHFGPPDYNVYTFSHGGWSPAPPVLNIGEAAWFTAPTNLLDMTINGNALTLSWTTNLPAYTLQTSTLITDSNSWATVATPPAINGPVRTVTLPISQSENRFFRLKQ